MEEKDDVLDNLFDKKEDDNIKNSITETNKKAYDILALFSAAITFLFGTVNIFIANHDKDVLLLICNTMGLGVLLILFMSYMKHIKMENMMIWFLI